MQLTYPWFSVALLGISIPVIIHLLQLRRPQRILFSNTAFIKAAELIAIKYRKVQQLLILLTRVIAVGALVIGFCQPFIPVSGRENSGDAEAGVGVFIDNSFSMQRPGPAGGALFSEAIAQAGDLGLGLAVGRKIKVVGLNGGTLDRAAYQKKLNELKISMLNEFSGFEKISTEGSRGLVYVFSDFQKNSLSANTLAKMGVGREVVLVPEVGRQVGNLYVDSVWLDDAFVRVRTNVALHVRVRNGGEIVAKECPVKVFLGERQVAAFQTTVAPGAAVASVVQVQVNDGALVPGRAVTEDGPVRGDNTYYFTLQPAAAIRVLEIGLVPTTQQLYGNEPLFAYAFTKPQGLDFAALRQANLVIVQEVTEIDASLQEGLRAVLKRGGSVVVVPSALAAGHDSYQRLFKSLGLGTVQWEAKSAVPELRDVAMPNARDPFFREVFSPQQRTVTMPRVAPVLRWARTETDILRLRDGESYLAGFASAMGKVYVFSAPFAKEYSDFAAHPLFVPVMYRMAMLSYRNEQLPAYRLSQETVVLGLADGAAAASATDEAGFRLVKDSLTWIPAQRVLGPEVRLQVPVGLSTAGFYQVLRRGKLLTTLAFNQDKRESELAAYSADELRQLIGPNRPNIRVLEGGTTAVNLARFQTGQTSRPLWRYCLALVLVGLLAEALLVRFGSRRVGGSPIKQGI